MLVEQLANHLRLACS